MLPSPVGRLDRAPGPPCHTGFTGQNCEANIDDCPGNNCKNGGACVDGVNTYNCRCPPEWTGACTGRPGWAPPLLGHTHVAGQRGAENLVQAGRDSGVTRGCPAAGLSGLRPSSQHRCGISHLQPGPGSPEPEAGPQFEPSCWAGHGGAGR